MNECLTTPQHEKQIGYQKKVGSELMRDRERENE